MHRRYPLPEHDHRAERHQNEAQGHERVGKTDFKTFDGEHPQNGRERRRPKAGQDGDIAEHRSEIMQLSGLAGWPGMGERPSLHHELPIDSQSENGENHQYVQHLIFQLKVKDAGTTNCRAAPVKQRAPEKTGRADPPGCAA